jgi:ubiquinone/menaquinone biosynthesis C-methylase UbiE
VSSCSSNAAHAAGAAFDSIAEQYDDIFTYSMIGRAQRQVVWSVLLQTFRAGDRVLELNCGTGEDALFLAKMGVSVYACDASQRMISVAAWRMANASRQAQVQLEVRPTEQIGELPAPGGFDGVFSNFSGLNCVDDLANVARQLAGMVKQGGRLVLCLSSRYCLWETGWYLAHGKAGHAFRRWKGRAIGSLGDFKVYVQYPTMRDIRRLFGPEFICRSCRAVGLAVPPSYVEHLARRFPRMLHRLEALDRKIAAFPGCRVLGDHMLLVLERTTS